MVPTSLIEHLNVRLLLTNAIFSVAYTFLQKPSSFKFLSILEENCGADITNISKIFSLRAPNASKKLETSVRNAEWRQEQSFFFNSDGNIAIQQSSIFLDTC